MRARVNSALGSVIWCVALGLLFLAAVWEMAKWMVCGWAWARRMLGGAWTRRWEPAWEGWVWERDGK